MLLGVAVFQDRRDAGRVLARTILASAAGRDCQDGIVLGLPRGGVPVANEVALALGLLEPGGFLQQVPDFVRRQIEQIEKVTHKQSWVRVSGYGSQFL